MAVNSCIFCKIISKVIHTTPIYESTLTLVVEDLYPKAPVHYLLIPKIHITHMGELTSEQMPYFLDLGITIQHLIKTKSISAFNIIANNGADAGQSIFHMHWHFLAGKNIYSSSFTL